MNALTALHEMQYCDGDACQDWTVALLKAVAALSFRHALEEVRFGSTLHKPFLCHAVTDVSPQLRALRRLVKNRDMCALVRGQGDLVQGGLNKLPQTRAVRRGYGSSDDQDEW